MKTLTFTVEDALLSPMGFAILSGAGLFQGEYANRQVHVHRTSQAYSSSNEIDLTDALNEDEKVCATAPVFVVEAEADGSITGDMLENLTVDQSGKKLIGTIPASKTYFVDYYVVKDSTVVDELQIDAENFGGYYYVEASTLFRRQNDGFDMPAELTFPNVKIQSNFTFSMASTGDPSTFSFTMDAFPGYTYFEPRRKVLCAMQIINDPHAANTNILPVFPHDDAESLPEAAEDSVSPFQVMDAEASLELGNKTAGDLVKSATISDNGSVTAELYKIDEAWTDFSASGPNTGYFFPTQINVPGGDEMTLAKKNGEGEYSNEKIVPYDETIVARIAEDSGTSVITDLRITVKDKEKKVIAESELHFDNITYGDTKPKAQ